ncbi:prolyl oligopeptidase family serine peptidase [Streptomyces cylindrosporus]|uniref:Acyl-peptide hydrolase n=1 Tax=Streptomyces cylindrosporus TaxID=2927583 RepID=A0ABS9Y6Y6_9ACTN|nr:prolyl oligopeptidase family serine peptidase [Streptomyces cylindrosporus]MCI3271681.1 prolyl oligopeptidase family serine peptidase [Streptomyces cylindrosporus]
MTTNWQRFFTADRPLAVRRGRGPGDRSLIVVESEDGPRLSLWDAGSGTVRPLGGLTSGDLAQAVLSHDGEHILALHDDNGSEVGHLHTTGLDGGDSRDLTPDLPPYTLRGIDVAGRADRAVITCAAEDGFSLWLLSTDGSADPEPLFRSPHEAWNGLVSADGTRACVDTTDHNPGIRRFAVTVVDTATGQVLDRLTDGPEAPVRGVRFSPVPGDDRILVATERTGFARPCVWHPTRGTRIDVEAPHVRGDLVPLDWSEDATRILAVHVDGGIHRVMEADLESGALRLLDHPPGAYFEPDVADTLCHQWASHYGPGRTLRLLHQRFDSPLRVLHADGPDSAPVPQLFPQLDLDGVRCTSTAVRSADGTHVQLWWARPRHAKGPVPLVLQLHGGPNLVTVDRYDPAAQAWLDNGVAYAALNYRGSVTFGRRFREGFMPAIGDRELEDIEAAVHRLVADGVADPDKVFVTGASYGGFLSLLSMGRLPGLFAGALAHVPMADWLAGYEDMNPALRAAWSSFFRAKPEDGLERFVRASPITYVADVVAPVWINQGTHDTRTAPKQVRLYEEALRAAGGDVVVDWYSGGHETTGRAKALAEQSRMLDLVHAALRQRPWSQGPL